MDEPNYRAVIIFFVLEGSSTSEILTNNVSAINETATLFPIVHRCTSVEEESSRGWPKSATTPEITRNIVSEIADTIGTITPYFTWGITYAKAFWKISATFVKNSSKTHHLSLFNENSSSSQSTNWFSPKNMVIKRGLPKQSFQCNWMKNLRHSMTEPEEGYRW